MRMKKRRLTKLVLVALLLMVGAMIFAFRGREPTYQGKSVTHWLRDLDDDLPRERKEKAQEALASIGARALPVLHRMLNARQSPEEWITEWVYTLPFVEPTNFTFSVTSAREKQHRALRGYGVLGTKAIPGLIRALNNEQDWICDAAASGLENLGPKAVDAVPDLIRSMKHRKSMSVIRALGKIGSNAKEAIPALTEAMRDEDLNYRVCVADALVEIDPKLRETNPAINEVLIEGENRARQQGTRAAPGVLTKRF
jgi:hypothetical protein